MVKPYYIMIIILSLNPFIFCARPVPQKVPKIAYPLPGLYRSEKVFDFKVFEQAKFEVDVSKDKKDEAGAAKIKKDKVAAGSELKVARVKKMTRKLFELLNSGFISDDALKEYVIKRFIAIVHQGARVDTVTHEGMSFLHYAVDQGIYEVVQMLLMMRVDADAQNNYGWTALHYAAHYGFAALVDLLLSYNADVTITTKKGRRPWIIAARAGHEDLARKLLDKYLEVQREMEEDEGVGDVVISLKELKFSQPVKLARRHSV